MKNNKFSRIHSDYTIENGVSRFSLEFWRKKETKQIIESLQTGKAESLKLKPDGRILNGNIRCKVLEERGFDVNSLEPEVIK